MKVQPNSQPNLLPLMLEYLDELEARDVTTEYIRVERTCLTRLAVFAGQIDVAHPGDLGRNHILRFRVDLEGFRKPDGRPLTVNYQHHVLATAKGWLSWLEAAGHIDSTPWPGIDIRRRQRTRRPLTDRELKLLFNAHRRTAFSTPAFYYHRAEVILTVLLGWGLRPGQLSAINAHAILTATDSLLLTDGLHRARVLPIGEIIRETCQRWMRLRAQHAQPGEPALLVSRCGDRLGPYGIAAIVRNAGRTAGLSVNPRRLSDTSVAMMAAAGANVEPPTVR